MKLKMVIVIICVCLLLAGGILIYSNFNNKNEIPINALYQGAVPQGYDLEYFRETGITKPLS